MPLLPAAQYITQRQRYTYYDARVNFIITQTGQLPYVGNFTGIFPSIVPSASPAAVNLRKFEKICQSVFADCLSAKTNGNWTTQHHDNIEQLTCAIVHWKMASQGGRAPLMVANVRAKWNTWTENQLLTAYVQKDMAMFRIGGVGIPTATAFMRFLFPDDFGIMDRRVVNNYTQPQSITNLSLGPNGQINNTAHNVQQYNFHYVPFLQSEALTLNQVGARYNDTDANGNPITAIFRSCDVEMALF